MAPTRRVGTPCPRCLTGQLLKLDSDEALTCLACGYSPPEADETPRCVNCCGAELALSVERCRDCRRREAQRG